MDAKYKLEEQLEDLTLKDDIAFEKNIEDSNGNVSADDEANNFLSWEEYFMAIAFLTAQRSKDPVTQVGACIVNSYNQMVGVGYNGMPNGCSDQIFPWGKLSDDPTLNKYMYVCHAEMNAISNKNSADVRNSTIYVTLFPCNECAKLVIQSGIKKIVYFSDKHADKPSTCGSKFMLNNSGVEFRKYEGRVKRFSLSFNEIISDEVYKVMRSSKKFIPSTLVEVLNNSDISYARPLYLKWEDYFMSMALLSAQRSKDPDYSARSGACIVSENKRIVGMGYNGMPIRCSDADMPWRTDDNNPLMDKELYVCHATMNAITNRNKADLSQCSLYCTHFPCNECAKLIIQSGLCDIKYLRKPHGLKTQAAEFLFKMANVKTSDYSLCCDKEIYMKINTNFDEVSMTEEDNNQ